MLNGLDLFSGIGGLTIALSEWVRPISYCEIDNYCIATLFSQMARGNIRTAPVWPDITTLDGGEFFSEIDVIYGGFPCQDISIAGRGKGLEGKRSGLFFEIIRLAKEIEPQFIFLENVPAITSRGGLRVVREIAEMGYDCRWCCISAASVGAPQNRERWFLLAYSKHFGSFKCKTMESSEKTIRNSQKGKEEACKFERSNTQTMLSTDLSVRSQNYWDSERPICRVADGIPNRMDRIRALGNAVVPAQAKKAFEILMGLI